MISPSEAKATCCRPHHPLTLKWLQNISKLPHRSITQTCLLFVSNQLRGGILVHFVQWMIKPLWDLVEKISIWNIRFHPKLLQQDRSFRKIKAELPGAFTNTTIRLKHNSQAQGDQVLLLRLRPSEFALLAKR